MAAALGSVYAATLLPGVGHSPDTAELQFAGRYLCVTHPTGYPLYLIASYAFSYLIPFGGLAFRANLLSAVCSVLACLVLRRLLVRLGCRSEVALCVAIAFGLTPTFWRMSIVAEVYTLHALFLVLVADGLVRWRHTGERKAFVVASAIYVASFGNHLTTLTVLPAFVFLVLKTRWRVVLDAKAAGCVIAFILLGMGFYAYPLWRSLDRSTPYLAVEVRNLADLASYATGAAFRGAMFPFDVRRLLEVRVPLLARHWWADCAVFLPLAAWGCLALKDRAVAIFFGLALVGHLAFSLNYDIPDIDVYFIPVYLVTAVFAGVGLDRLVRSTALGRVPAAVLLALPMCLGALHFGDVKSARGEEKAEPMRDLLDATGDRALIVARYNDYMYLLNLMVAEGLGGTSLFVAYDLTVEEIAAYLQDGQPIYLAPVRKWVPPGLRVYCAQRSMRPALRAAGLDLEVAGPAVYRVRSRSEAAAPSEP